MHRITIAEKTKTSGLLSRVGDISEVPHHVTRPRAIAAPSEENASKRRRIERNQQTSESSER
jgi:hypothetical protein